MQKKAVQRYKMEGRITRERGGGKEEEERAAHHPSGGKKAIPGSPHPSSPERGKCARIKGQAAKIKGDEIVWVSRAHHQKHKKDLDSLKSPKQCRADPQNATHAAIAKTAGKPKPQGDQSKSHGEQQQMPRTEYPRRRVAFRQRKEDHGSPKLMRSSSTTKGRFTTLERKRKRYSPTKERKTS